MKSLLALALMIFATALSPQVKADPTEAIQMQRLIESSQQQLRAAQELLKQAKQDGASMDKAAQVLDNMSKGLDTKIQTLQGTKVYDQALVKLQEQNGGAAQASNEAVAGETEMQAQARQNFAQFQQQSVRANSQDMLNHEQVAKALETAPPGYVAKLQAQAQLGQWQSNLRLSTQLTELLGSLQNLRKDLKGQSADQKPQGFGLFLSGSSEQSEKLERGRRVP